jgi:hypothetical protein
MSSYQVTVVANSVYHHDQSIEWDFMIQILPDDLTKMRRCFVMLIVPLSSCL